MAGKCGKGKYERQTGSFVAVSCLVTCGFPAIFLQFFLPLALTWGLDYFGSGFTDTKYHLFATLTNSAAPPRTAASAARPKHGAVLLTQVQMQCQGLQLRRSLKVNGSHIKKYMWHAFQWSVMLTNCYLCFKRRAWRQKNLVHHGPPPVLRGMFDPKTCCSISSVTVWNMVTVGQTRYNNPRGRYK